MTEAEFREAALACPQAIESGHMGQADFRVAKKIFATLDAEKGLATLKLQPKEQAHLIDIAGPAVFPANGSWGQKGWTRLSLAKADTRTITPWLMHAWRNTAPARLLKEHP